MKKLNSMLASIFILLIGTPIAQTIAVAAPGEKSLAIHVVRDSGCGCCEAWIEYLREQGFEVTAEKRKWFELSSYKIKMGVPQAATSCHTATIGGYVVEGHVPVSDIKRLLSERPNAVGLSVPGMPYGSPGMGPESEREAYDVLLISKDGNTSIFTRYPAK